MHLTNRITTKIQINQLFRWVTPLLCVFLSTAHALTTFNLTKTPQTTLTETTIYTNNHPIIVEIARDEKNRKKGLMYRKELKNGHGMLFVFQRKEIQCFWMKNTQIPLVAIFIKTDGSIANIAQMKPFSVAPHCSLVPVPYVLEISTRWFEQQKFSPSSKFSHLPTDKIDS